MSELLRPRAIRERLHVPRIKVAVIAGVSEPSVRQYEADRNSVSRRVREALDPVYADLAREEGVP